MDAEPAVEGCRRDPRAPRADHGLHGASTSRLAPRVWGHGYATEAARALVEYGFGEMALRRVVALILPANTRSQNVASKCGMTVEGPGRFYGLDLLVYAREAP